MKWLRPTLEPEYLVELKRGMHNLSFRFPTPAAKPQISITIRGGPRAAHAKDIQSRHVGFHFENGQWTGTLKPENTDYFDLTLELSKSARAWPLTMELSR